MDTELLTFYNVENFYQPDKDSAESYHSGLYNWDEYKYNLKVRKISNVFRFIEEDFGQLPSIIGLAEIGAKSVLEDLTQINSPLNDYEIIYEPSQDSRNLSVALLFDKEKFTLLKYHTLQFQLDKEKEFDTRDILQAEFSYQEKKLHIFILHLPSKRNRDIKKDYRNFIIEKLKETLQKLFDKGETVVLMGDFNENPDNEVVKELLFDKDGEQVLNNPFEKLFNENQFSTYHGKKGVCFDQILFTEKNLIENFTFKNIEAQIYNSQRLRNKDNKNSNYPSRTYSGSRYMSGYSDHFPVILKLFRNQQS